MKLLMWGVSIPGGSLVRAEEGMDVGKAFDLVMQGFHEDAPVLKLSTSQLTNPPRRLFFFPSHFGSERSEGVWISKPQALELRMV